MPNMADKLRRVQSMTSTPSAPPTHDFRPAPPPIASFRPGRGMIICPNPNCGYQGRVKKVSRGSSIVALILLLFFLVPGLLYILFKSGYRYVCPRCGMQIGRDG